MRERRGRNGKREKISDGGKEKWRISEKRSEEKEKHGKK